MPSFQFCKLNCINGEFPFIKTQNVNFWPRECWRGPRIACNSACAIWSYFVFLLLLNVCLFLCVLGVCERVCLLFCFCFCLFYLFFNCITCLLLTGPQQLSHVFDLILNGVHHSFVPLIWILNIWFLHWQSQWKKCLSFPFIVKNTKVLCIFFWGGVNVKG